MRSRRRRWRRGLRALVLALVIIPLVAVGLAGSALLVARTEWGRERLRRLVLAQARSSIPGLELGHIGGGYLRDLTLDGVVIRDRQGRRAVRVERIAIRYDLLPLLRRVIAIRELRVVSPRVIARPADGGASNLVGLITPPTPTPTPTGGARAGAWRIEIARLVVGGGAAELRAADGRALAIEGLNADGWLRIDGGGDRFEGSLRSLEAGASYRERRYHLALSAHAALDPMRVDISVPHLALSGLARGAGVALRATAVGPRDRIAVAVQLAGREAGRVTLEGHVGLTGAWDAPALGGYDLTLASHALDPGAVSDQLPRGRIDAQISAHGRGVPLRPGSEAKLAADASSARLGDLRVRWMRLSSDSTGGRVRADLSVALEQRARARAASGEAVSGTGQAALQVAGDLDGRITVHASAEARQLRLGDLRIGALDLHLSAERPAGGGGARAARAPSGHLRFSARAVHAGGSLPPIDTVDLQADSDGHQLSVRGAAAGPRLSAELAARGAVGARAVAIELDRLSVGFDEGGGRQTIALRQPARLAWRAGDRVELGAVRLHGAGHRFNGDLEVGGLYRLGPARNREEPLARLDLGLHRASFGGLDPIDARVGATIRQMPSASVSASSPSPAALEAVLEAHVGGAQIHGDATVPVSLSRFGPRGLAPRGPIAVHLATGRIALRELPLLERELARRGLVGGMAHVDATVEGDIAHPRGHALVEVSDATIQPPRGMAPAPSPQAVAGLGAWLRVDAQPGQSHLAAQASLPAGGAVTVDAHSPTDLGALLAGADPLDVPWRATVEIAKLRLAPLLALLPSAALAPRAFSSASAAPPDETKGTDGVVTGKATLTGTARRPIGTAELAIAGLQIDGVAFSSAQLSAAADADRVRALASVEQQKGGNLRLEAEADRSAAHRFKAHLRVKQLDLRFLRPAVLPFVPNLREVGGKLQAVVDVTGSAATDGGGAAGAGAAAHETPTLNGEIHLDDGKLGISGQPTFHDIAVAVEARSGKVEIDRFRVRSGDGLLEGKGHVLLDQLRPASMVLTAHAKDFQVDVAGASGGRLDGDLAIEAALRASVLSGELRVPRAALWLPRLGGAASAGAAGNSSLQSLEPHAHLHFVDAAARAAHEKAAAAEAKRQASGSLLTEVDIRAVAETVYVRGREFELELESDLHIGNAHGAAPSPRLRPALSGTVRVRRGRIEFSGRRFAVERGTVTFDGAEDPNPALDIRLAHGLREAVIAVEVGGTLKKPEVRLLCDPPIYDQAQIVSLILTGRAGSQGVAGENLDATAALTSLLFAQIAGRIVPQLGLDVVRIANVQQRTTEGQITGQTDTRVEIGRYVGDRIYLSYAHVFGAGDTQNSNEAQIEYRLTSRWIIETVLGDSGVGGVDALWTHRY